MRRGLPSPVSCFPHASALQKPWDQQDVSSLNVVSIETVNQSSLPGVSSILDWGEFYSLQSVLGATELGDYQDYHSRLHIHSSNFSIASLSHVTGRMGSSLCEPPPSKPIDTPVHLYTYACTLLSVWSYTSGHLRVVLEFAGTEE